MREWDLLGGEITVRGYVEMRPAMDGVPMVRLTPLGRQFLDQPRGTEPGHGQRGEP